MKRIFAFLAALLLSIIPATLAESGDPVSAYLSALDSANQGADYLVMRAAAQTILDGIEQRKFNTDDFQTAAFLLFGETPPSAYDDLWTANATALIERYFVGEGASSLNLLSAGLPASGDSESYVIYGYTPESFAAEAGLSTRAMRAILGDIDEYGISVSWNDEASPAAEQTMSPFQAWLQDRMGAQKGSNDNPVPIGEPFSFIVQVNADGTMRTEATEDAHYEIPITVTLSRYLLPDYYEKKYSLFYQLKGDEAGVQLDITLGTVEGLESVSMQDAILGEFEDTDGGIVIGYKFTDAEIGGESQSVITTGESGTIYKRFQYDPEVALKYLTITYFMDGVPTTIYFSLE